MSTQALTDLLSKLMPPSQPLPTKSELLGFFKCLTSSELAELDQLLISNPDPWLPQPGPQTAAFYSLADELYYGGAAGGGKTDLLLGLACSNHIASIIFRREYPQLESMVDRSTEVYNKLGRLRQSPPTWRLYYKHWRKVEMRAMALVQDAKKFQGRPHDLKAYDEITHFTKYQYLFTKAWNRSVYPGQRCRVVCAGNPPTDVEGRWVIEYWAPWLDEKYSNPAAPGELRWFITVDGRDYEVEDSGRFKFKGQIYESRSRTFIPSSLQDNAYLADTGYSAALNALPEPLRSQLLYGDFKAGITDDPWQIFPTEWVRAAMARWKNRPEPKYTPIDQLGVDVARGGEDRTVLSPRRGNYFCEQQVEKGVTTSDGMKVAALVIKSAPATAKIAIDAIGVGASPLDWLRAQKRRVVGLNASNKSEARDKTGLMGFCNKRAEWHWKFREMLDPESGHDIAIPDDPELLAELCAIKWELTIRGVKVMDKDEVKELLMRSPDKSDSLIYASAADELPGQGLLDMMEEEFGVMEMLKAAEAASEARRSARSRY